jgi:Helix-turn-helix domain
MSILLAPLPDHDPLKPHEVAAALGLSDKQMTYHLRRGRFPGAFRTPGQGAGPGRWRIPRDSVIAVGRELGVWP